MDFIGSNNQLVYRTYMSMLYSSDFCTRLSIVIFFSSTHSNLLRPSGVQVQKGTLYVRLYLAEHLPQMDPEYLETMKRVFRLSSVKKEDLVDPYCKVSFAGYHCQTKTIKNQRAPFWNQQINFPISVR